MLSGKVSLGIEGGCKSRLYNRKYGSSRARISQRWEYFDRSFLLPGESRLKSGKRGWFAVSKHIDWRCGWCLKIQCPITEALQRPGFKRPLNSRREFNFEPDYCGSLSVNDERLIASFRVPDCLDPPGKKVLQLEGRHCSGRIHFRVSSSTSNSCSKGWNLSAARACHSHPSRWHRIRLARFEKWRCNRPRMGFGNWPGVTGSNTSLHDGTEVGIRHGPYRSKH